MRIPLRNQPAITTHLLCAAVGMCLWMLSTSKALAANGELEIRIVDDVGDETDGDPIAAQLQIRDRRGRVRPIRKTASWNRQYAVDGRAIVSLPPGNYTFSISRGPEYLDHQGHFQIESAATDTTTIRMKRFTDLSKQGWWSADLALSHAQRDMDVWIRSADLHVASAQSYSFDGSWKPKSKTEFASKWNQNGNHWFAMSAGRDNRFRGGTLVLNGPQSFSAGTRNSAETQDSATARDLANTGDKDNNAPTSSVEFLKAANRFDESHICVARPNSWDLPIWLASGYVDSFMLLGPELRQDGKKIKDPEGFPRDPTFYPEPRGWGQFAQDIYYHILNSGFKIPPVAGSGSGANTNPVGYSRTYVHCDPEDVVDDESEQLDIQEWWKALRAGRVMVTNGPLLIPTVNGKRPGHVFQATAGETVRLTTQLTLHTREKIEYLEIVKNGRVMDDVMLSDLVDKQGVLPDVEFTQSGWFLIRAITKNKTYHAASTGPFYVDFDDKPFVSGKSVKFFVDWLNRQPNKTDSPTSGQHKRFHAAAAKFWRDRAMQQTSE